ncbi:uncharacterized protein [Ptychodera flava]|uniref:uncharacterized protein n=1 Tax=Ptychodera flava TaxID=63121 RepID=UPI00396AA684
MEVLRDGITVINRRRDKSSDLVRGKKGYHHGVHVFEVNWPTDERGSHPMIGVASVDTPLSIADFTYLLGRTSDSWGWNLATKELFHDGKIHGQYPTRNPDFEVPETFYIILNAEDGTLSFRTNFENLGVAFRGLPNQDKTHPLYVSASATFAFCRIRLKYKCSEGESDFTVAPLPTGHSYYKFNSENRGRFVVIEMRGRVAKKRSPNVDRDNSVVLTRQPLKFDEAFEVRLDSVHAQWTGNVEIGVTTNDPRKLAIPETMADCEVGETLLWSGDWLLVNGEAKDGVTMEEDLEDCTVGDRVGIVRRRDGCVQFLFNGRILESSIRFGKQSQDLYGVIDLYGKAGRVTIMESETAAARVTYDLTTSMREEFENNHPNAIMFRMRDIVDKIKCEQYTSLREELNDIASGILLPFYQSTDQNLRRFSVIT